MSVSACPIKGPAVPPLQTNSNRTSFFRIQTGNLSSRGFTAHSNPLSTQVHPEQSPNNNITATSTTTSSSTTAATGIGTHQNNSSSSYQPYRKLTPTITDTYSTQHKVANTSSPISSPSTSATLSPNGSSQPHTQHHIFQSPTIRSTDPVSESIPPVPVNSVLYRTMDYSTLPVSFNSQANYMTREHTHDLKTHPSTLAYHDTRSDAGYMRVDFNPIVESLNFATSCPPAYESGPNHVVFNSWATSDAATPMDLDSELKCRVDFRSQLLTNGSSMSRMNDDFRVADNLYPTGNTRRPPPPSFNAIPRGGAGGANGLGEMDHFGLPGSGRVDSGPHCLPHQFDVNGYSSVDSRTQSSGMGKATSTMLVGTNNGSGMNNNNNACRGNPGSIISPRSAAQCMPPTSSTQTLVVSASENSVVSSAMMTPDSSTTGFAMNKFNGSSDDGEISPAPTNSSGRPHTPGRVRKAAPTLATGRRNLKGELVDPDEADRRMKRRERNRKSAQKCRERKVQRTQELQAQVEYLQMEINRLTQERDSLRSEARQFVTLLQLHCPGVAIPYMSCLNDMAEAVENNNNNNNIDLVAPQTMVKNAPNLRAPNTSGNWKAKTNGKPCSLEEVPQSITIPSQNSSFSPLPTMVSLHSHLSPTRAKTSLNYNNNNNSAAATPIDRNDMNGCLNSTATTTMQPSTDLGFRAASESAVTPIVRCTSTASVQGPASSSSSSSCSAYELSFANLETPVRTPVLGGGQYEDSSGRESNHCSTSDQSSTFPIPQSHTVTSSSTPPSSASAMGDAVEPARVKCEEWDSCFMDSIQTDKIDSIPPLGNGTIDTDLTGPHCDLHREGGSSGTPNRPGADGIRY